MGQFPLSLLIIYNNILINKENSKLDYALYIIASCNVLEVASELFYLKFYKNQGINLEQRIELPHKFRFWEYIRLLAMSLCCGSISIIVALSAAKAEEC